MLWTHKHLFLFLFTCLFSVTAVGEDVLRIDFGEGWEIGGEDGDADCYTIKYVPVGQSTEEWSHLLTFKGSRVAHKRHKTSLRFLVNREEKRLRAQCRHKTWWTVLWEKEDRVIYRWRTYRCTEHDDQTGIAAYISGESTLFRVAYTKKTKKMMSPYEKRWWEKVLLDAEVEPTQDD